MNSYNVAVHDIDDCTLSVFSKLGLHDKVMYHELLNTRYSRRPKRNSRVFVEEQDGMIIAWGFAFVRRYADTHNMFSTLRVYVKPKFRRVGLGKKIVNDMIMWAKDNTRSKVIVAQAHDKKSSRTWTSCGLQGSNVTYRMNTI